MRLRKLLCFCGNQNKMIQTQQKTIRINRINTLHWSQLHLGWKKNKIDLLIYIGAFIGGFFGGGVGGLVGSCRSTKGSG